MVLTKQEKEYKRYLTLKRKLKELQTKLEKSNWIPLPEPVQRGWNISLVLRGDIKQRKDAYEIQEALNLCQYSFHTRDLKLVKRIRNLKSFRKVRSITDKRRLHLPSLALISEKTFKTLHPSIAAFFEIDVRSEKWKAFGGSRYRLSIPSFWLELKAHPHIVTHYLDKGGELEKEYKFIHDKLRLYWLKYSVNYSSSFPAYKDRCRIRDKIQKFKKSEIEDITIEKIPREYDW